MTRDTRFDLSGSAKKFWDLQSRYHKSEPFNTGGYSEGENVSRKVEMICCRMNIGRGI